MKIDHIAIWTRQLEILKEFYTNYFQGKPGTIYHNKKKNFKSYFLSFGTGARLEIMSAPGIPDNQNNSISSQHQGILDGPRITGDGYYEFVTLDPDNNRLEVTAK